LQVNEWVVACCSILFFFLNGKAQKQSFAAVPPDVRKWLCPSDFLLEWEGSETELRGCAARCAEAAMPFRKPLDFYRGYAPQVGRLNVFRRFEPLHHFV
jgi:hypothetical protein